MGREEQGSHCSQGNTGHLEGTGAVDTVVTGLAQFLFSRRF